MILKFTIDDNYKAAYKNNFKKVVATTSKPAFFALCGVGALFILSLINYIKNIGTIGKITFAPTILCALSLALFIGLLYIYFISSRRTLSKITKYNYSEETLKDFEDFRARYDLPSPRNSNMDLVYIYFKDDFLVEEKFSSAVYHKLKNFKEVFEDNSCLIISCKNNFIIIPLTAFKDNEAKEEFILKVKEVANINHSPIAPGSTKMLSYLNLLNTTHYVEGVFIATILLPLFLVAFRYDFFFSLVLLIILVFINRSVFRKIYTFDFNNSDYLKKASFNCQVKNLPEAISVETDFYIIHLKKDCLTVRNLDNATILLNENFNLILNDATLTS